MRNLPFIAMAASLAVASCTLETSGNGELDGYWQLSQVDSLHNGSTVDMRPRGIYWAVQMNMLRTYRVDNSAYFFRFTNTGDSLLLSNPYRDLRDSSDIKVTDAEFLRPYGVNSLNEHFAILTLEGGRMTLQSERLRLYFKKY